jgi:hypothetical protein
MAPSSGKVMVVFILTQKALFFSTSYLRSKLWMVITVQIHLNSFKEKKTPEFLRQCMAAYCTCDDTDTSRHWWNTCTTPTLQSRPHPMWFFWHFQHLNMSYKARNFALTLKWNKPSPQPYARCLEMAYCPCLRSAWGDEKTYSMRKGHYLKKETVFKTQESHMVSNVCSLITFQTPLILTWQFLLYWGDSEWFYRNSNAGKLSSRFSLTLLS